MARTRFSGWGSFFGKRRVWSCALCLAVLIGLVVTPGRDAEAADDIAAFYKGKRMTLVIGGGAGGTYDVHGRLVARHLGRGIPGSPGFIVQNMPGASSVKAANYVYGVAPQDGTVIGNLLNTLPLAAALKQMKIQADITNLHWIGNLAEQSQILVVWHTSPVKTVEDARKTEVLMGATSYGALSGMLPKLINHVLDTKFKVVTGYTFPAIGLAMARGEVQGQAGIAWIANGKYADRLRAGKLRVIMQIGFSKAPELPDVPIFRDLVGAGQTRDLADLFSSPALIGNPSVAGPKVPQNRVAALRQAYQDTMKDAKFLADAKKLGIAIRPVSGSDLEALIKRIINTPPALVQRAKAAVAK